MKEGFSYDLFKTSWGWVGVVFTPRGLRRLVLPRPDRAAAARDLDLPPGAVLTPWKELRRGLREFLRGQGTCPSVPVDLAGCASFTRRVLEAARRIPSGTTVTYGELAHRAGSRRACQAVGQVMARNAIPLVVPCHRVVAAAGLGGYGGGQEMKARLLALELRVARGGGVEIR
jgi:methylated-DNA-[protein]-cysteine S-methyltransferase